MMNLSSRFKKEARMKTPIYYGFNPKSKAQAAQAENRTGINLLRLPAWKSQNKRKVVNTIERIL
jgi:hypothetical protein